MQKQVEAAYDYAKQWLGQGTPASYIPELAKADPDRLAVSVAYPSGAVFSVGDSDVRFTLQSISKVITLLTALNCRGYGYVFERVGMEPSGDPFNSIIRLETMDHRLPMNPMINAGAISVTACIPDDGIGRFGRILETARLLTGNPQLDHDRKVFASERATGDKNRAMAYMMRSSGVLDGDVEEIVGDYFRSCSILANSAEISRLGAVLANGGRLPGTGEQVIDPLSVRVVRSLMSSCGMYDESGWYALHVGVPSKSGVGGGILAAVPGRMGIGVFSPALDKKGNSLCGIKAMEYLSHEMQLSIF